MNYYNENDRRAAAWLRELIKEKLIPDGFVDERSIVEVRAIDLLGYTQCHFFAGIGGWPLALRIAGWPDDKPVWTGSCPCQPFSIAGKGLGKADPRHLWPFFRRLIRQSSPQYVFGEQVASSDGRLWLDGVQADLEALGFANCAADLCAAGVGAPNIRQRLFWMAVAEHTKRRAKLEAEGSWQRLAGLGGSSRGMAYAAMPRCAGPLSESERQAWNEARLRLSGEDGGWVGNAERNGFNALLPGDRRTEEGARGEHGSITDRPSEPGGMGHTKSGGCGVVGNASQPGSSGHTDSAIIPSRLADSVEPRLEGHAGNGDERNQPGRIGAQPDGPTATSGSLGFWSDYEFIQFTDGKTRRIEPGLKPLVDGLPGRVGLLRGYGNAIVPEVAAEFISAAVEALT